jgi:hypothetical protein
MKMAVFWVAAPCSLVEVYTDVSEVLAASIIRAITYRPHMEAASTSETLLNFYQTTQRNNKEDSHLRVLLPESWFLRRQTSSLLVLQFQCYRTQAFLWVRFHKTEGHTKQRVEFGGVIVYTVTNAPPHCWMVQYKQLAAIN